MDVDEFGVNGAESSLSSSEPTPAADGNDDKPLINPLKWTVCIKY